MQSPNFFIPMLVAILIIVVGLIALPLIVTRLTQPRWALFKSAIEFSVIAILISVPFSVILGVPIAFAIVMVRHRSRVARYTASPTAIVEANLENSETTSVQINHERQ